MAANQALSALLPPFRCNSKYLLHHFDFIRDQWLRDSGQTTQANINGRAVKSHSVPLPPADEQLVIARILDTLDTQIRRTEELIAKLEQIKQGLLTDLLTRGIDQNGQLRPPPDQAPHLYKDSPLGRIPREWESSALREKAQPGVPHLRTGPFGSTLKGEHWVQEGHPVITIGSLREGEFDRAELLYVGANDAQRLVDYQLNVGDVVFSRVADVGRSVAVKEAEKGWIMSSNLMRISLDSREVDPSFLQLQLGSATAKAQVRVAVNAGGRDVANSAIMNQLVFLWPGLGEQQEICARMRTANGLAKKHLRELHGLRRLKDGLVDDLLTGRVRVRPLLDVAERAAS
jgi:type I restriction enzyme S subunit